MGRPTNKKIRSYKGGDIEMNTLHINPNRVINAIRNPVFGGRYNTAAAINYGGENIVPNTPRKFNTRANKASQFTMSKTSNVTRKNMRLPAVQRATMANSSIKHANQFAVTAPSHIENYKQSLAKMAIPAKKIFTMNRGTRHINQTRRLTRPIGQRGLI